MFRADPLAFFHMGAVHSAPMLRTEHHDSDRIAFDRAASARTFDSYGRMHVQRCNISKANVCPYFGREIPNYKQLGLDPNKKYQLYRHPDELAKGATTFRNLQLMLVHTKVTARDPKTEVTVGTVGDVSFDGQYLVADQLTVWTGEGIQLIESEEAAELSSSYGFAADMTPGVTPAGVAYDGVMRDIRGNHVALVREGRAGSDVAVNDSVPESHTMKRSILLAGLIARGIIVEPANEEARVALDAKLAEMTASDANLDEDMEDDPENPGKKRKKINPGRGEPMRAGGGLASDEAIDAAITARGYISKADAEKLANDAAVAASADAVAKVNALHVAREAVKPLVGVVVMDSADSVYKFALEQEKVALDGVPAAAYPALVRERVALRSAGPAVSRTTITADAANAAAAAIPGLGRIQQG